MHIGFICRVDGKVSDLPQDWRPMPLGTRSDVISKLRALTKTDFAGRSLTIETATGVLELSVDDADPVETLSIRSVLSSDVQALLHQICESFDAKYYDSEEGDFVNL